MPHDIPYPKPPTPIIDDRTYRLPSNQYVNSPVKKTAVCLHHTVSGSAKSVYNWWLEKGKTKVVRVGTAYVVDKDGTIYRMFPDDRWAWHLGKGVTDEDEARTIGIEIVSEGGLVPVSQELHAFYNPKTGHGTRFTEEVVDLGTVWRGYRYFDAYSQTQILSVISLVDYLCDEHDIPRIMYKDLWHYQPAIKKHKGIFTHAQVRSDKTDVHPKFPVEDLAKWTKLTLI